ncbi:hypothetical protein Val02_00490 [Virgisporangium aliadipatigenens]|uniref:Uncharacterized protein n=1 Tax=Virgisporangium aliadipatigenens TaxID=741659 RepID=A0A8J3YFN3_9ACTN|nr:hypothetical protein [Virgisporangium aliadipatigenens]GIJ43163.1 hypothetical protein Val02_00490 [Virgisporangium aliadipatigenens]
MSQETVSDLHSYVLDRLDSHLAELQRLRRELAGRHLTPPGERRRLAAATATAALRYGRDIDSVLEESP